MLNRIEIKGFQSLHSLDLELGRFTLITGESHAGKSAFLRALQAVASNIIGTSSVTSGMDSMSITLDGEDYKVSLHRTVSGRDDYYKIVDHATGKEDEFRTLGVGGVPDEVTKALGISPVGKNSPSINFHIQGDKPYLLAETGSVIARQLGELTNVTTIFEAVREGNRRRTGLNAELKGNIKALNLVSSQVAEYLDLPAKDEALARAEEAVRKARELDTRITILESSLAALRIVEQILSRPVPTLHKVRPLLTRAEDLRMNLEILKMCQQTQQDAESLLERTQHEEDTLHEALHEKLVELGVCPTCGSEIS